MTAPRLAQRFSPDSELHLPPDRVTVLGPTSQFEAATLVRRTLRDVAKEAQNRRQRHIKHGFRSYEEYFFYASSASGVSWSRKLLTRRCAGSVALGILHERARTPYGLPGTYRSPLVEEAWWAVGLPSNLQVGLLLSHWESVVTGQGYRLWTSACGTNTPAAHLHLRQPLPSRSTSSSWSAGDSPLTSRWQITVPSECTLRKSSIARSCWSLQESSTTVDSIGRERTRFVRSSRMLTHILSLSLSQ